MSIDFFYSCACREIQSDERLRSTISCIGWPPRDIKWQANGVGSSAKKAMDAKKDFVIHQGSRTVGQVARIIVKSDIKDKK